MSSKFEITTTLGAAVFGVLFFGAVWWFSGMQQWAVEAAVFGGVVCGLGGWAFHALVRELGKDDEARRKKMNREQP